MSFVLLCILEAPGGKIQGAITSAPGMWDFSTFRASLVGTSQSEKINQQDLQEWLDIKNPIWYQALFQSVKNDETEKKLTSADSLQNTLKILCEYPFALFISFLFAFPKYSSEKAFLAQDFAKV